MSQITLKPLDDGQKAVEIPLGKTTIGRGPLLGCSDKKVSRNHAVLEVTNKGEVFLTPTHVNPCFFQPTADSPGQILKKDVPHKLENGDSFSLLPRAYRYQLIVAGETSQKETPDQNDGDKQVGKTNGTVTDILNDGVTTNEELGDTIPEKPFNKEEVISVEKTNSKEENTFSKKIAEIKDNNTHDFPKDSEENSASDSVEKSNAPLSENDISNNEPPTLSAECKESEKEEPAPKGEVQKTRTEPEINDESDEGYVDAEEKSASSVNKVTEENDTTPDLDLEPQAAVQEEQKVDSKVNAATAEEKISEKEPLSKEESEIKENANEQASNEIIQDIPASEDAPIIADKMKRKRGPAKKSPKEKQPLKRKTVRDGSPKPRGRKKTKLNFDDAEAGTSRQPGRTSSRTNRQTRQGLSLEDFIVSDDDEWQSDRSEPKTRRKRGRRRGDDSGSDWEVEHKKTKKPLHKVWSGSESGGEQNVLKKKKGPKGRRKKEKPDEEIINEIASDDDEEEEEEPQPSSSAEAKLSKLRIPCTYGKKCYRRSTNHKDQFSHPGDSDYTSETEPTQKNNDATISDSEDDSPKKECPYGANCFRKNPQHKKDFKHTKKVRPQREAAKQADKKAKHSRNSDEVDSYDLNDSFLNDDSADEYNPVVDSGSDYESGDKVKKLAKVKGSKRGRGKKV